MARRGLAIAAVALGAGVLAATAPAARDGGYATIASGAHLGAGQFAGKVRAPSKKIVNGISVRRRCADRRRIDTGTHDGSVQISLRTTRKGRWRFTLPAEPGKTIKVFVLAKQLPGGAYCRSATLKLPQ
jgi:hypothetical protein